jgi:hypothetical protein
MPLPEKIVTLIEKLSEERKISQDKTGVRVKSAASQSANLNNAGETLPWTSVALYVRFVMTNPQINMTRMAMW